MAVKMLCVCVGVLLTWQHRNPNS